MILMNLRMLMMKEKNNMKNERLNGIFYTDKTAPSQQQQRTNQQQQQLQGVYC